jgi:uncharacterized protein (TIGR01244 family)
MEDARWHEPRFTYSVTRRRMTRGLAILTATLATATSLLAGVPEAVDPADIPNYRVIHPGLAFGGQPSPETLKSLGDMGFRTVVNIRTAREGAPEEGPIVRALDLDYVWVPVSPGTFSLEDVEAIERVLEDPDAAPVLLHCASSNRVAAVWAVIQAREGRTLEEAEAAARATGLHSPSMWEAVLRVLEEVPVPAGVNP